MPTSNVDSDLHRAILEHSLEGVEDAIARGANIDAPDPWRNTPLQLASEAGLATIARRLVRAGAQIDRLGRTNQPPLSVAVGAPTFVDGEAEQWALVEDLLARGADINGRDPNGATALHALCWHPRPAWVERLIDLGADPDAALTVSYQAGQTPLHAAVSAGHGSVIDTLLARGADPNVPSLEPLLCRAVQQAGHEAIVERLLAARCDPAARDTRGRTALQIASERGHRGYVRQLMSVPTGDENLLHGFMAACRGGDVETLEHLQSRASLALANTDLDGETPLGLAVEEGWPAAACFLLERGADPNKPCRGITPLQIAVQRRYSEIAKILIEAGAAPVRVPSARAFPELDAVLGRAESEPGGTRKRPRRFRQVRTEEAFLSSLQTLVEADVVYAVSLSGKRLAAIPPELARFANLSVLELDRNRIREVPSWLFTLHALEQVDLADNQIAHLGDELGQASRLKALYLQNNPFSEEERARIRRLTPRGCKVIF
jgi:ankyrin repeat protein